MTLLGYPLIILVGISLGLIGAGGSILTVPILVYMFKLPPAQATAYSLFIVGLTALFGSYKYWRQGLVESRMALIFGIPSFLGVFLVRRFVVPAIPEVVFSSRVITITGGELIMFVFAMVMIFAARSMIFKPKVSVDHSEPKPKAVRHNYLIVLDGILVGGLTGFVGAGGGFLVIPALVKLAGLPMKTAVGTSLAIIAIKSLFGFLGDVAVQPAIDWVFLGIASAAAICGIFVGVHLAKKIPGKRLEPAFGWFVLVMGVFIVVRELMRNGAL